jgi:hypothetical protein
MEYVDEIEYTALCPECGHDEWTSWIGYSGDWQCGLSNPLISVSEYCLRACRENGLETFDVCNNCGLVVS